MSSVERVARRVGPAPLPHLLGSTVLGPVLTAATAAAGSAVVLLRDPNQAGLYPTCPVLFLTGLHCPGCGTLRMLHHLADGRLDAAFTMNPLALLLLPVLLVGWSWWTWRVLRRRPAAPPVPGWLVWTFLVVVCGYTVLRNVPGLELLAPG